jgi:transposase InsO family protein
MPWKETTPKSQRAAFIEQAKAEGANISALCRAYGISRKTAYKWLKREREGGEAGLEDQSRRPQVSPGQTAGSMERQVLAVREEHPDWGGRKIRKVLQNRGETGIPAASTIGMILQRNAQIDPAEALKHRPLQRFEREQPNELWQMDFKGHFPLRKGGDCHPLTVLDDHSRFLVGLKACADETFATVQQQLTSIFRQFGLPERMLMDNGAPWGGAAWGDGAFPQYTTLTAWLLRLDIAVSHGRAFHPQTQGKNERFNRTLKTELLRHQEWNDLPDCQSHFDQWGHVYNYDRPHTALQLAAPASRYSPSPRPFPETLPPVAYEPDDVTCHVDQSGKIYYRGSIYRVGAAFRYQSVALRPLKEDGTMEVFFCKHKILQINLLRDKLC